MIDESPSIVLRNRIKGRSRVPIAISFLTSLWLWFGYVSSARQTSTRLQLRIQGAQSALAGTQAQEESLSNLQRILPPLERKLGKLSHMLWLEEGGKSLLGHMDSLARSAEVRIHSFSAAHPAPSSSVKHWKCDLRASFLPLLLFLRKMTSSDRIVHVKSMTVRSLSATEKSSPTLHVSLHLVTPVEVENRP